MNIFTLAHAKILYLRFCAIYGDKFVKAYHDDDFKSVWATEWSTGLVGIDTVFIKDALDYCKKNLSWPPSIAEFRSACEHSSGIPELDKVIDLAIRREFKHPVVLIAYEIVGSWALKNDKEVELKNKFKTAYTEAINKFRENGQKTWDELEQFNLKKKLELEAPSKIPSQQEKIGFKERLAEYQRLAEESKVTLKNMPVPEFDSKKTNKGGEQYDEYNKYLLSVPENLILGLPPVYAYDRKLLLNKRDTARHLIESGYVFSKNRAE
jgi:hypothetical protein